MEKAENESGRGAGNHPARECDCGVASGYHAKWCPSFEDPDRGREPMKIEVDRPRLPKDVEAIIDEFPLAVRTLTRVAHLAMAAAYTDARGMGRWECDERADLHRAAADA